MSLDKSMTPPMVLEPYSRASGPRIISTPLYAPMSVLTAWSMEVLERSPVVIPSSVSKNLCPLYPLKTG